MSDRFPFAEVEPEKEINEVVAFIAAHPKLSLFLYSVTIVVATLIGAIL